MVFVILLQTLYYIELQKSITLIKRLERSATKRVGMLKLIEKING